MTNLQALLREHKLAYTFIFFKKIRSDAVWELSIQSIRSIPISEDMPNADPVKHRTPNLHQVDGTVWGHWWIETQTYFTRRVFPKKSNWKLNTGRKEKYTFYLNRKGKSFRLVESWFIQKSENTFAPQKNRDHFLICLNKPKCTVWTKQSFFSKQGALPGFWLSWEELQKNVFCERSLHLPRSSGMEDFGTCSPTPV